MTRRITTRATFLTASATEISAALGPPAALALVTGVAFVARSLTDPLFDFTCAAMTTLHLAAVPLFLGSRTLPNCIACVGACPPEESGLADLFMQ